MKISVRSTTKDAVPHNYSSHSPFPRGDKFCLIVDSSSGVGVSLLSLSTLCSVTSVTARSLVWTLFLAFDLIMLPFFEYVATLLSSSTRGRNDLAVVCQYPTAPKPRMRALTDAPLSITSTRTTTRRAVVMVASVIRQKLYFIFII